MVKKHNFISHYDSIRPLFSLFFFGMILNFGDMNGRYHLPRSWVKPSGNLLVLFEEWGGEPNGISLAKRSTSSVCADVFEGQPTLKNWQMVGLGKFDHLQAKAHLWCPPGQKISKIKFASFGMPQGTCGSFKEGSCHAHKSYNAFEKVCLKGQICKSLTVVLDRCCDRATSAVVLKWRHPMILN